jgi:hypothetical protein
MALRDSLDSLFERGRAWIAAQTPRDRALLLLMAAAVLGTGAWFGVRAMNRQVKRLEGQIAALQEAQQQVDELLRRWTELKGTDTALDARLQAGRDFTPLTWLEQLGNEMGIFAQMTPSERGVEETDHYKAQKVDLMVRGIDLRQTTDLMWRMLSAPQAIRIDEVRVTTDRKERSKLDVRMQLAVLKPLLEGAP